MALGYVLFAFLVWVYATRLGPKDEGDYAQLSPWRTWVRVICWRSFWLVRSRLC